MERQSLTSGSRGQVSRQGWSGKGVRTIPETRDLSGTYQLVNLIRALYKSVVADVEASSSEAGLTFPQTLALWLLHFEDGLLVSELARRGLWHVSTALGIVTRLEAKGLVRLEDVEKGRGRRVYLTEEGRKSREQTVQYPTNLYEATQAMTPGEFSEVLSRAYDLADRLVGTDYVKWLQRTADKHR